MAAAALHPQTSLRYHQVPRRPVLRNGPTISSSSCSLSAILGCPWYSHCLKVTSCFVLYFWRMPVAACAHCAPAVMRRGPWQEVRRKILDAPYGCLLRTAAHSFVLLSHRPTFHRMDTARWLHACQGWLSHSCPCTQGSPILPLPIFKASFTHKTCRRRAALGQTASLPDVKTGMQLEPLRASCPTTLANAGTSDCNGALFHHACTGCARPHRQSCKQHHFLPS